MRNIFSIASKHECYRQANTNENIIAHVPMQAGITKINAILQNKSCLLSRPSEEPPHRG